MFLNCVAKNLLNEREVDIQLGRERERERVREEGREEGGREKEFKHQIQMPMGQKKVRCPHFRGHKVHKQDCQVCPVYQGVLISGVF